MTGFKKWVQSHGALYCFFSFCRRSLAKSWMLLNWARPIERDSAVIVSYYGGGFGDNGKAIALKLLEKRPDMKIYWAASKENMQSVPTPIIPVRFRSPEYYALMARAEIWIDNSRKSRDVLKRRGQFYMQTWHGGLGLKRAEKDAQESLAPNYIKEAQDDSRMADVVLSDSAFFTEFVRRAFWYDGEILKSGSPRMDTLFKITDAEKAAVKRRLGLKESARLALYAPTFRVDGGTECYRLDFAGVLRLLGDDWAFAVRLHPNISDKSDFLEYSSRVVNATPFPDMYELLAAADILITDYSSCMFDAAAARKPVFLYASDVDEYMEDRALSFDIGRLPFPLAQTNEQLISEIRGFDREHYLEELDSFLKDNAVLADGCAADRAAEYILKRTGKEAGA